MRPPRRTIRSIVTEHPCAFAAGLFLATCIIPALFGDR